MDDRAASTLISALVPSTNTEGRPFLGYVQELISMNAKSRPLRVFAQVCYIGLCSVCRFGECEAGGGRVRIHRKTDRRDETRCVHPT